MKVAARGFTRTCEVCNCEGSRDFRRHLGVQWAVPVIGQAAPRLGSLAAQEEVASIRNLRGHDPQNRKSEERGGQI